MSISKGALNILIGRIAGILTGFLFVLVIPRLIGPENMGFYSYWFSIFVILTIILDFGGNTILNRFIPELKTKNPGTIKSLLKKTLILKISAFIPCLIIGLFVFSGSKTFFLIITFGSLLYALANMMAGFFYGFQKMGTFVAFQYTNVLSRFILLWLGFLLFDTIGIIYGITFFGLVYVALFIKPFIALFRSCGKEVSHPYFGFLKYGFILFIGTMFLSFILRMLVPITQHFIIDMVQIGHLGFAFIITIQTFRHIPESFVLSLFPKLVELNQEKLSSQETTKEIRYLYSEGMRYVNMLAFPMIAGLLAIVEPVIRLIVGTEYLTSLTLIPFFLPAFAFMNWVTFNQFFMMAEDKVNKFTVYCVVAFVFFIISCFIAIPQWGIVASPVVFSLSIALLWFLTQIETRKYGGLISLLKSVIRPGIASFLMWLLLIKIPCHNIITLVLQIALGGLFYVLVLVISRGISKDDTRRFLSVFKTGSFK